MAMPRSDAGRRSFGSLAAPPPAATAAGPSRSQQLDTLADVVLRRLHGGRSDNDDDDDDDRGVHDTCPAQLRVCDVVHRVVQRADSATDTDIGIVRAPALLTPAAATVALLQVARTSVALQRLDFEFHTMNDAIAVELVTAVAEAPSLETVSLLRCRAVTAAHVESVDAVAARRENVARVLVDAGVAATASLGPGSKVQQRHGGAGGVLPAHRVPPKATTGDAASINNSGAGRCPRGMVRANALQVDASSPSTDGGAVPAPAVAPTNGYMVGRPAHRASTQPGAVDYALGVFDRHDIPVCDVFSRAGARKLDQWLLDLRHQGRDVQAEEIRNAREILKRDRVVRVRAQAAIGGCDYGGGVRLRDDTGVVVGKHAAGGPLRHVETFEEALALLAPLNITVERLVGDARGVDEQLSVLRLQRGAVEAQRVEAAVELCRRACRLRPTPDAAEPVQPPPPQPPAGGDSSSAPSLHAVYPSTGGAAVETEGEARHVVEEQGFVLEDLWSKPDAIDARVATMLRNTLEANAGRRLQQAVELLRSRYTTTAPPAAASPFGQPRPTSAAATVAARHTAETDAAFHWAQLTLCRLIHVRDAKDVLRMRDADIADELSHMHISSQEEAELAIGLLRARHGGGRVTDGIMSDYRRIVGGV